MNYDDDYLSPELRAALNELQQPHRAIATELRMMAEGVEPYARFAYVGPRIKAVWLSAAQLIDDARPPLNNAKPYDFT